MNQITYKSVFGVATRAATIKLGREEVEKKVRAFAVAQMRTELDEVKEAARELGLGASRITNEVDPQVIAAIWPIYVAQKTDVVDILSVDHLRFVGEKPAQDDYDEDEDEEDDEEEEEDDE